MDMTLTTAEQHASRRWNVLILAVMLTLVVPMGPGFFGLIAGDWDFWSDWKDRVFYPLLAPASLIVILSLGQYAFWRLFRIPGATILVLGFVLIYHWPRVFLNFHIFAAYPLNFVWPSVVIPGAILLDVVFMLTRRWLVTSLLGGIAFGSLFYVQNLPAIAPLHQPLLLFDKLMTLADLQGFEYARSATPEYLRTIESGGLRTFSGQTPIIAAAFAGMVCIAAYWLGQALARFLVFWPFEKYVKRLL